MPSTRNVLQQLVFLPLAATFCHSFYPFRCCHALLLLPLAATNSRASASRSPTAITATAAAEASEEDGEPTTTDEGEHARSSSSSSDTTTMNSSSTSRSLRVRVVSYNVLSSHLAGPAHFTACDPLHLDADNRLPKVLAKLDREIPPAAAPASSSSSPPSPPPVVFCLQEVSHHWAGKFHAFFANRNYHFVTGLYGRKFNGYMGVGLAFPTDVYEAVDVNVGRLSDFSAAGWPEEDEERGIVGRGLDAIGSYVIRPIRSVLGFEEKREIDHWDMARNRQNILLFARLREKKKASNGEGEGGTFCISNYHMPCAFYAPMVMTIHADLVVRRTQDLAMVDVAETTCPEDGEGRVGKIRRHPHILAGDFNFLPESSTYKLVTTGKIEREDAAYPTGKNGMDWTTTMAGNGNGMRSAYAESEGGEPDFTNYAKIKDDDPFIGTLDYIFLSEEWRVTAVEPVPHRTDVKDPPFPNAEEPSDHVLIAADLELPLEP